MRDTLLWTSRVICFVGIVMIIYGVYLYCEAETSLGAAGPFAEWDEQKRDGLLWAGRGAGVLVISLAWFAVANIYGFLESCGKAADRWLSDRRKHDLEGKA